MYVLKCFQPISFSYICSSINIFPNLLRVKLQLLSSPTQTPFCCIPFLDQGQDQVVTHGAWECILWQWAISVGQLQTTRWSSIILLGFRCLNHFSPTKLPFFYVAKECGLESGFTLETEINKIIGGLITNSKSLFIIIHQFYLL